MQSGGEEKRTWRDHANTCGGVCYSLPWCAIILVVLAVSSHTAVLVGNLATARTFSTMGHSTGGWSDVGLQMSHSLVMELETDMSKTTKFLTSALALIVQTEQDIDFLMGSVGNNTQSVISALKKAVKVTREVAFVESDVDIAVMKTKTKAGANTTDTTLKTANLHGAQIGAQILAKGDVKHMVIHMHDPNPTAHNPNPIAMASVLATPEGKKDPISKLKQWVKDEAKVLIAELIQALDRFFQLVKPALLQIGRWLHSMGAKMQGFIEQFSTTIDRVQKIFDQIMTKVATGGGDPKLRKLIVFHTFNIFDVSHTGAVSEADVQDVANLYGVTALQGAKGKKLFQTYDEDGGGSLDMDEYDKMMSDPSLPSAMTYVLRTFSKKLASIAGVLKGARKRDEVAESLSNYLTLMTAKNLTKVGWVSQTLTNGSLPIDLSVDVFRVLAEAQHSPDKLTDQPVGEIITTEMVRLNASYVHDILRAMSDANNWAGQGWDPADQQPVVDTVTGWISNATLSLASVNDAADLSTHKNLFTSVFLEEIQELHPGSSVDEQFEAIRDLAEARVVKTQRIYQRERMQKKIRNYQSIFYASSTKEYYKHLLSESSPVHSDDADITKCLRGGIEAAPETLRFAQFLVNNATATAQRFQGYAFNYVKTSSNQIDSFANGVQALVKKTQNFLNLMMKYSTPRGINEMEAKLKDFAEQAMEDLGQVVDGIINRSVNEAASEARKVVAEANATATKAVKEAVKAVNATATAAAKEAVHSAAKGAAGAAPEVEKIGSKVSGVWKTVKGLLKSVKSIVPTVVDDIKFAQHEVSMVSSFLHSIFSIFKVKGSPLFEDVSSMYKTVWTVYFALFATMTSLILYYAFWSQGWFKGPPLDPNAPKPPPPATFMEKCSRYCSNCLTCMRDCQDGHLCFWSCLIFSEFVILILFVVSIVFCILAGLKLFLSMGCAQIYVLGDNAVCTSIMEGLRSFLSTFWTTMPSALNDACTFRTLTACSVIKDAISRDILYTVCGSFAATIFSFQLLFEAAHLHEQAYWTNKMRALEED